MGGKILWQVPLKSFFGSEAEAGWDFCLNLCEFDDRDTGTRVARMGHIESSSKFKKPFLFKTSAYLAATKGDLHLAGCIYC